MPELILLADGDLARGNVVELFLSSFGFTVVRCSTVREVLERLAAPGPRITMLLADVELEDGGLLPALEQWFCELMRPLPRLLLWGGYGEVDYPDHEPFIELMHALILPVPLDVDLVTRLVRLFATRPEALRPPSPARSCPAVERRGHLGRRCCVHAVACARKRS
jgi:DNA-binding NtrC family response regulator